MKMIGARRPLRAAYFIFCIFIYGTNIIPSSNYFD